MRRIACLAVLLACVPSARAEDPDPKDDALAVAAKARAALAVPDDVWAKVVAGTEQGGRALGYTGDEMKAYGGREHLLRTVENLFRDVREAPRTAGRVSDELFRAAAEGHPGEVMRIGFGLTDVLVGRNFPVPAADALGLDPKMRMRADEVLDAMRSPSLDGAVPKPSSAKDLPAPVIELAVRLLLARGEARRWLALVGGSGGPPAVTEEIALAQYRQFRDTWEREEYGLALSESRAAFDRLRDADRAYLGLAATAWGACAKTAVARAREAFAAPIAAFEGVRRFPLMGGGELVVAGTGDDVLDASAFPDAVLVIDLGGKDRWKGRFGSTLAREGDVCVAVDLGGDDVWDAADVAGALGCGWFGIGAVIDLAGDDAYTVKESGLGCAWFGAGLLWDLAGDDAYVVRGGCGQGAAYAGVGALLDVAGNDRYECAIESQGYGATLGAGLLVDLAGNDAYVCRDDGNVSELYLGQSVAMAQGCGQGRRADLGDGHSLAGGWGLLLDLEGDDRYHAQCWSQGCGYWWGVGLLEDRAGDDVYENGKYSSGAAAHYAVGCHVDLAGNDRYDQGVATAKNQYQGHARDASIGVFLDGGGNDRYFLRNMCAGSGNLCSVALFWDRAGDDSYEWSGDDSVGSIPPCGTATADAPMRHVRDDLATIGVFLDTGGGTDVYPALLPAKNSTSWKDRRGPRSFGFGLDE